MKTPFYVGFFAAAIVAVVVSIAHLTITLEHLQQRRCAVIKAHNQWVDALRDAHQQAAQHDPVLLKLLRADDRMLEVLHNEASQC